MLKALRPILVILFIIAFASIVSAQSQKLSPHLEKAGQPSHMATESRFQSGTEQAPIFVKILPSTDATSDVAQEREERNVKATTDWSTRAIAIFTLFLAISTTGLWFVTKGLLKVARQSADAAKRSADALVAVELPIFIIEKINISKELDEYSISLGNHGRTPAIITRDCFVLKLDKALDPTPRYPLYSLEDVERARIVENRHEYKISRTASITDENWKRIYNQETILWAYGYIDYVDFLKIERRDGFCIAFDPGPDGGRWIKEGPAAYTYSKAKSEIKRTIHQRP